MSAHPYRRAPKKAFWAKSVAENFDPTALVDPSGPLIRPEEKIMSAGSCFAANIVPYLERAGFHYLRTERIHPAFAATIGDNFSYAKFTAAYGNIYSARQLLQLLRRCLGSFAPEEDRWTTPDAVLDPFRPGLRYPASTELEFEVLAARHLERTREGFETADVFVFTLGLTEAWVSAADGAVFPACPGTVAGRFDSARHRFVNFSVSDVVSDLSAFLCELKAFNPRLRTILTVSPVPLVATATGRHVLVATSYSKSVLRAAAGEIAAQFPEVTYFPAYEIVTGPQAQSSFGADRRTVSASAIAEVMRAFLAACGRDSNGLEPEPDENVPDNAADRVSSTALSKALSEAECEEAVSALD